jgi:hypothetical protein
VRAGNLFKAEKKGNIWYYDSIVDKIFYLF